ncbi:M4 family metallopeptidase [Streptomyces sp. NPDC059442]|uniref:M4 family metallopeptidase n=2 Tax=unclassified Streptomyces TaxID=2593676 RepID=UPI00367E24A2
MRIFRWHAPSRATPHCFSEGARVTRLQTSHHRPSSRATARAAALLASAAMVVVGVQSGSAGAATDREDGATALVLSAAQRTAALQGAQAEAATTARAIGLSDREGLVVRDVVKDADGTVHTRYERTYEGLPVLGGDLVVHKKKDGARSTTKATDARISVPATTAAVPADTARRSAAASAAASAGTKAPAASAARKVVWAATGKPVLAWETVVTGVRADGTPSERHVIADATSGKELYAYEAIDTGTGNTQYSGQVTLGTAPSFTLTDTARGGHKTYDLNGGTNGTGSLFTNSTDVWGNGQATNRETAAADAHYGAAVTWDFYKNELGRNGIRGDGVAAYSRVHYGDAYVNAFWSDQCFCMTYGDGTANLKPLTSLDVAGHEMSHGLTASTAGLRYSRESGGLNEATSDILGTAVEFYAANSSDVGDYLIGEKIDIRGNGTPLRYMDRPSRDGNSADSWSKNVGRLDVHYSSGPANHFFYLLSEGSGAKTVNGVAYDSPTANGSTVTGIGRTKAYKIWYKALSTYMTSSTDYAGARTATLKAAGDLYGTTGPEYAAVGAAWAAVNVN